MKYILLLTILLSVVHLVNSQTIFCGSNQVPADPALQPLHEQLEQQVLNFFQAHIQDAPDVNNGVLTIPVVVHIIYDNGLENISDAQVQQGISWLNAAYANSGYFDQGSGTNVGIQFCLAQRTPDGLTTNGITRNQSALTNVTLETQDVALKNLNRWEPKQYLNIWLVRGICSTSAGCGVVGYAYRPEYHGTSLDGLVIEAQFFGAVQSQMSVAAHELGHYLGLYHTFEGGCTNNNCLVDGDRICDTPPDQSTAAVDCGQLVNTCSTDVQSGLATDQPDMTVNFLDYGNINCFHDFTPGQAARMNFYLNGIRHSLLNSKGCLPPCTTPVVSAFHANATTVNTGQNVVFANTSQYAASYQWLINGVLFSTTVGANYIFSIPGTYTITLVARPADVTLCDSATSQVLIEVICPVVPNFTISRLHPGINEPVTLMNFSAHATMFSWTINGVPQSDTLSTVTFSTAGVYTIQLTASDGTCAKSVEQNVFVQDSCTDKTFQMQYKTDGHGESYAVTTLSDGNIVFIGRGYYQDSLTFSYVSNIAKLKPDGTQLWMKTFDPSVYKGTCWAVAATADGGFVIGLEGDSSASCYIAKLTATGALEWTQSLPGVGYASIRDIKVNVNQEILVLVYAVQGAISGPIFVKFGPSGNLIWIKRFAVGEPGSAWRKITLLPDGGLIGIGRSEPSQVVRLTANGDLMWSNTYSNSGQGQLVDIAKDTDSTLYLCGRAAFSGNLWLLKINANGQIVWSKTYTSGVYALYTLPERMVVTDGGLTIAGRSQTPNEIDSKGLLARFDADGNLIWNRVYAIGVNDNFKDLTPITGGYLVAGNVNLFANPPTAAWLLKTDINGYAGTCASESVFLSGTDLSTAQQPQAFPSQVAPTVVPASFPMIDLPNSPTFLCEKACPVLSEICYNQLDDDGDGLIDCTDPDCACIEDVCHSRRNNHWYFGPNLGLDFSTEPPTNLYDGKIYKDVRLTATISDNQGKLLLYTDGVNIHNRFHQVMPHGSNPDQPVTSNLNSIIVPYPGNPALYYVFIQGASSYYALVDMRLDNGKGDVVSTAHFNILTPDLESFSAFTATRACSFDGYWLAIHDKTTKTILVYRIDQNGLQLNPVISPAADAGESIISRLKFSPNGKQLAHLIEGDSLILYDFDLDPGQGGSCTNPQKFKLAAPIQDANGLEYSPTGHYIYVNGLRPNSARRVVYQLDVEAGSANEIAYSSIRVADYLTIANRAEMQLAPNGKIYLAEGYLNYLSIIHRPDAPGLACQFERAGQVLAPSTEGSWTSFPNCITSDLQKPRIIFAAEALDSVCGLLQPVTYRVKDVSCIVDSINWSLVGLNGTVISNHQSANVTYISTGQGQLIATAFTECGITADTLRVRVYVPSTNVLNLGPDRMVCDNGVFTFNAGSGFAHYRWQNGSTDSVFTTLLPGKYWVDVYDACGNRQTDTVIVRIAPASVLELGPDFKRCSGTPKTFSRPGFFATWNWSPATFLSCDTCSSITVDPATTATWTIIAQTANGCLSIDTLHWQIVDTLFYTRDTTVCVGQTAAFYGVALPADTTAIFLRPSPGPGCDSLITVQVLGIETPTATVQIRICADQFFNFRGTLLPADTTAIFYLPGVGCDSIVTVAVQSFPLLSVALPADTSLSIGASLTLPALASGTGSLSFQWQPGVDLSCTDCLQPLASPLDTITYVLQVTDERGCIARDSITLRVDPDCRLIIPNAFTPNGDGVNDWFYPQAFPCVRTVRLWRVLNRWGVVVFERRNFAANERDLGWDGRYQGKEFPSDVLVWQAELEYFDGRVEQRKGEITLLR